MPYSKLLSGLVLPILVLLWNTGWAQNVEGADVAQPPEIASLNSGWWSYFEGAGSEVAPKVATFLEQLKTETGNQTAPLQSNAESLLDAVNANLSAYLALLDENVAPRDSLPPLAPSYSIDELLELASAKRVSQDAASADASEEERAERIVEVSRQRRDTTYKQYLNASAGSDRWLAGMALVRTRSALAISERRLELLAARAEQSNVFAREIAERLELIRHRLDLNVEQIDLTKLDNRQEDGFAAVREARERLQSAERAATELNVNTSQGSAQQRLQRQTVIAAKVELALAEARFALAEAHRRWVGLKVDDKADVDALEDGVLRWSALTQRMDEESAEWLEDTETELIAAESVKQSSLGSAARKLRTKRSRTAQDTLGKLTELDNATNNLRLVTAIVEVDVEESAGRLQTWFSRFGRRMRELSTRAIALADATLFEISETPVTPGDLLRVLLIVTLAFFLSRGVRHALQRMNRSDHSGTRASLYTVGRLLHYFIIISAALIALSSIGLDFSNLALVAGALSVGIGFGLQSIVSNFVSGLIILFERTLRVGDYIELDTGLTGTVKSINVRSTLINTNDNIDIVVPNSEFITTKLTNWTLGERTLRVRIPFGVAYGTDKEIVRKAALEAAEAVPYTLTHTKGREPDVWLVELGDNSLNFLLLVWVNQQGARRPTRTRAAYLWELESALVRYGIEIPYPQRDIHIRSGPPTPELTPL